MPSIDHAAILSGLAGEARTIRHLEEAAHQAALAGNSEANRERLRDKARLLTGLGEKFSPQLDALQETDPVFAQRVRSELESYRRRAGQALQMDSPFYMFALLYPEEHAEGEPNDFERFIESLGG